MTVAQLIELLKQLPQDAQVYVDNPDCKKFQFPYNVAVQDDKATVYVQSSR